MKKIFLAAGACLLLAGCETTGSTSRFVEVAGHPYKTDPGCSRKKPLGKFDQRCDEPLLGYGGFTDPSIGVGSGGVGGFQF